MKKWFTELRRDMEKLKEFRKARKEFRLGHKEAKPYEESVALSRVLLNQVGIKGSMLCFLDGENLVVDANETTYQLLYASTSHLMRWVDKEPKGFQFLRHVMKSFGNRWDHSETKTSGLILPGDFKG